MILLCMILSYDIMMWNVAGSPVTDRLTTTTRKTELAAPCVVYKRIPHGLFLAKDAESFPMGVQRGMDEKY